MAARVGTGVTLNDDAPAGATSVFSAKATTTGTRLFAGIKWESGNVISGIADTALNAWAQLGTITHSGGEPFLDLWWTPSPITGNAANVATVTWNGTSSQWRRGIMEEFSGLAVTSPQDGSTQSGQSSGTSYSTSNIVTTTPGLVILAIGGYTSLSSWSGTPATPDFTMSGLELSDTGFAFLISGSAQTVTPAASASGSDRWVALSAAFKDEGGGATKAPPPWRPNPMGSLLVR